MCFTIGGDGAEVMILFGCPFNQLFNSNTVTATPSSHATVGDYERSGPLIGRRGQVEDCIGQY